MGRQGGLFIDNQIGLSGLVFPLGLENLHDDLLLLNEESSHDLLPHGLVTQHSAISPKHKLIICPYRHDSNIPFLCIEKCKPEDCLLPSGHAMLLLVGGRSDTLQFEACHRALGHGGALLQVLQEKAAM